MRRSRQDRSSRLGYAFLGIAVLLTVVTLFLALTGRSLADLTEMTGLTNGDADPQNQSLAEISATMTASAEVTPTPEIQRIPEDLELSAGAVLVIDVDRDLVLFERNADDPRQPASTAKIFTALVVLKYASTDEVISIVESDVVDPAVESSMGLQAGDHVTVNDLLVGLMLASGNDAANALSRTIGARIEGPEDQSNEDRFIAEMNGVASELGLQSTHLRSPAGLDRDEQVVTARELAVAAEALLERPLLRTIVAMSYAEIMVGGDNPRVISVESTNELLVHDGVHGVKTGTTGEAGQNMVVAYRNGDSTIIAVILGSEDRYRDARSLLGLGDPPPEEQEPGVDAGAPESLPENESDEP